MLALMHTPAAFAGAGGRLGSKVAVAVHTTLSRSRRLLDGVLLGLVWSSSSTHCRRNQGSRRRVNASTTDFPSTFSFTLAFHIESRNDMFDFELDIWRNCFRENLHSCIDVLVDCGCRFESLCNLYICVFFCDVCKCENFHNICIDAFALLCIHIFWTWTSFVLRNASFLRINSAVNLCLLSSLCFCQVEEESLKYWNLGINIT